MSARICKGSSNLGIGHAGCALPCVPPLCGHWQHGHLCGITAVLSSTAAAPALLPTLSAAAEGGHAHCVASLLRRGANPNTTAADGTSPLLAALEGGYRSAAEALLATGAQPGGTAGAGEQEGLKRWQLAVRACTSRSWSLQSANRTVMASFCYQRNMAAACFRCPSYPPLRSQAGAPRCTGRRTTAW